MQDLHFVAIGAPQQSHMTMASTSSIPRHWGRFPVSTAQCLFHPIRARSLISYGANRSASGLSKGDKRERDKPKKKRKARAEFHQHDLENADQFALCDAMRYLSLLSVRPPKDPLLTALPTATSAPSRLAGPLPPQSTILPSVSAPSKTAPQSETASDSPIL